MRFEFFDFLWPPRNDLALSMSDVQLEARRLFHENDKLLEQLHMADITIVLSPEEAQSLVSIIEHAMFNSYPDQMWWQQELLDKVKAALPAHVDSPPQTL